MIREFLQERRGPLTAGACLVAVGWILQPILFGKSDVETQMTDIPDIPPIRVAEDTLRYGQTLAELMAANGISPQESHAIARVIREYKWPRTIRPGVAFTAMGPPGEAPERVHLQLNQDSLLKMLSTDSGWVATVEVIPVVKDTVRLAGIIESSLWFAELSGEVDRLARGEYEEFVYNLADVFAWKIDFTRDIRVGDAFRVVMEREVRPDSTVRSRRFLAIEMRNRGKLLSAIPFQRPEGRREYFDTEGEALRGAFLRYPVPYRITSGYSSRRYHPVLKRTRAHRGIDYGAPYGTRVQATADGSVTRAGWWSSYGRIVEIRHTNGIRTRYAHLSRINVRVGQRVRQGDIVGRVGATGLATGPHLHYEFLQNDRHRNPLAVQLPAVPALEKKYMEEFKADRDRALALLEEVALPAAVEPVAAAQ